MDGESITTIGMSIDWKETRLQKSNVIVRNSLMVKRILEEDEEEQDSWSVGSSNLPDWLKRFL